MRKITTYSKKTEGNTNRIGSNRSTRVCSCGHNITKKEATTSGYDSGSQGFHIHCPKCGKTVNQFVKPE